MDRNTKAKKKVDYVDIFENNDKGKDSENDLRKMWQNTKAIQILVINVTLRPKTKVK